MQLMELLDKCAERQGSSLYIKAGLPVILRVGTDLVPIDGPRLTDEIAGAMCLQALDDNQRSALDEAGEVEGSIVTESGGTFQWNVFRATGSVSGIFHNSAVTRIRRAQTAEEAWSEIPHFAPQPEFSYEEIPAMWPPRWESPSNEDDQPDSGEGSAPVTSPLVPVTPVRTVPGAKVLPPDATDRNRAAE